MAGSDLFSHKSYRDYLRSEFSGKGEQRGRRAILAKTLKCQTSFLSLVLTDRAHLSLEHALKTSFFLNHTETEKKFFMLLVQKNKAGNKALEAYFEEQLNQVRVQRENIRERIGVKTELSVEDQMRYYSAWYFSALHILSALPGLNTVEAMCKRLRLDAGVVKPALEFLEEKGFVVKNDSAYGIGSRRIHLASGSAMLPRHHCNWRMKAMEAVDQARPDHLHYSAILGISKSDLKILKAKILQLIQEMEPVIQVSHEEVPVVFTADWFEI